ncbi:MAG TPA: ACT domain-containing protein [Rectinemataceae bacterium]|nr:ACT domain-containing protein [Rectinemataceae bacterium]
MRLKRLKGVYSICRLDPRAEPPAWANSGFVSMTRTETEFSVVCESRLVPGGDAAPSIKEEGGWGMIQVLGPLDFGLVGVISSISKPLADYRISIFSLSTFDTDYFLVKDEKMDLALGVLRSFGFEVE